MAVIRTGTIRTSHLAPPYVINPNGIIFPSIAETINSSDSVSVSPTGITITPSGVTKKKHIGVFFRVPIPGHDTAIIAGTVDLESNRLVATDVAAVRKHNDKFPRDQSKWINLIPNTWVDWNGRRLELESHDDFSTRVIIPTHIKNYMLRVLHENGTNDEAKDELRVSFN